MACSDDCNIHIMLFLHQFIPCPWIPLIPRLGNPGYRDKGTWNIFSSSGERSFVCPLF